MLNVKLNNENHQNLEFFQDLLQKDTNTIVNEALEEYFLHQQKRVLEKKLEDENALTNLSYNEFWDDIEI
jgi:hypothetical protein